MKRNGKNMKMPKVEGMTSDKWSTMTNMTRAFFLKNLKKQLRENRKNKNKTVETQEVEVVED